MRRRLFAQILFLILTAALILTSCGESASAGQPAPQDSRGSEEGETSAPQGSRGSEVAETAESSEIAESSEMTETVTAREKAEPAEAGGSATAVGAVSLSSDPCPAIPAEKYPKVDGSTATLPLSYALFQAATGEDEETAMETIKHNKTDYSYRLLISGSCDLVLAYEPSEETRKQMEEEASLQMKPIGRDALVFLVNASNPVKSLTEAQLQAVYSGETTNWKELGGEDQEIIAFQRTQNSGSQTLMEKLVMKGIPMAKAPAYFFIRSMGDLLEKVSSYDNQGNAIGYSVYFYARNMYSVPGLEFLPVDGVTPSNDTIQDGSYPYVNEFYAAIRGDEPEDSPARLLFNWLTSEGGQELIADTGYVPVLDKHPAEGDPAALVMTEKGETSYELKEDQVILMDGDSWFNSPAVHIMNADMTERGIIEGYIPERKLMVWSINEPLILMDVTTGNKGLYDIGKGKWIIEPDGSSLFRNSNGDCVCSSYGEPARIYNGSELLQIETEYINTGEYYWIKDDTGYSVRKGLKEICGHVDVEDPEQSMIRSGYRRNIVELDPGTGRQNVYTSEGELIFKLEYLQSEYENWQDLSYYVSGDTNRKGLLRIRIREDNTAGSWIYDIETGDYVWIEDEDIKIIQSNKEGDYAFQINGESGLSILTDSLEPLKASDGTPYEYCFGMDCYGYRDPESGNIVVENPDGSIHFEMPYHKNEWNEGQGTMIARGVILYRDRDLSELISYGSLLCRSDTASRDVIIGPSGGYGLFDQKQEALRFGENILVIRTDTGEVTYQSSEDYLVAMDSPVLVFQSGNWLYFRDPKGNLVMKAFADQNRGD